MPAFHDFICTRCSLISQYLPIHVDGSECLSCHQGTLEIHWNSTTARDALVHKSERAVVYISDSERKVQFPMSNNEPMPKRLEKRGYRRLELNSASDLRKLEKQEGVASHALNYDRGTGHSFDG